MKRIDVATKKWTKLVNTFPWFREYVVLEGGKKIWKSREFYYPLVGMGWYKLIWDMCTKIKAVYDKNPERYEMYNVTDIKEKYGGLRYYTTCSPEEFEEYVREAEGLSYKTCEKCGKPGKTVEIYSWFSTLCKKHENARRKNHKKRFGW